MTSTTDKIKGKYNETAGKGILPTPTIGAVGLLDSTADLIAGQPQAGDIAYRWQTKQAVIFAIKL